jgi:hypothetical protein
VAAVDLDEAGQGHGGKPGRLCGGPILLGLLRLQAVQIIRGALRVSGGSEYRPLVVLQHHDPRRNVGGMILADFRRQVEVGAKEGGAKLRIYDVLKTTKSDEDPNAPYFAALERLTAEDWRRSQ